MDPQPGFANLLAQYFIYLLNTKGLIINISQFWFISTNTVKQALHLHIYTLVHAAVSTANSVGSCMQLLVLFALRAEYLYATVCTECRLHTMSNNTTIRMQNVWNTYMKSERANQTWPPHAGDCMHKGVKIHLTPFVLVAAWLGSKCPTSKL